MNDPPAASQQSREYRHKRFMELWPDHEMTLKMKDKGVSPTKIFKKFEPDLKKLWNIIREKTRKSDIPVKNWGNVTARDLDYLKDITPNLTKEEVEKNTDHEAPTGGLSPPEWHMRKALLRDVEMGRIEDQI